MSLFENALQDLRFGARSLRKNPAITAIAALSLALGIGANTAIFSLIDTVLLKMLPVRHPQELVLVSDPGASGVSIGSQGGARSLFSCQEFEHIRDRQQVFDGMYAAESNAQRVSARIDGGPPENIRERLVSGAYFPVLGVEAAIGRTFTAQDDRIPRNAPYAVISYRFWTNRFGKSADVLGKSIRIHNAALTVIGVAPQSFFGETVGAAPDVWIPMMMQPLVYPGRDWLRDDEHSVERVMWLQVMGRLKPGVSLKQAQANISVVFQQILAGYEVPGLTAEQHKNQLDQKIELHPGARGASSLRDDYSKPLYVLMAVVGMVLLIACANIANLLLARATARQKEIAVRLAMGASRFRLGMQFLTESLLLSLFGGAVAVLIAGWGTRILLRVVSRGPETVPLVVHTDSRVLAFTAALAILTGILFGLAPALRATRLDAGPILKDNSRGVTGASRVTLGKVLVVAQIAISLLLLIGAGLFVRTLRNLRNVNLGYQPDKLVLFDIDALEAGYKGHAGIDLFNRVLAEIRTIPGVRTATFSQNGLFSGSESGTRVDVEGYKPAKDGPTGARFDQVGPDYFSSLGIPVLRGREIGRQDTANSTPVCVVNEAFVKDFFKGAEPLGKHIRDLFPGSKAPPFEIVGVVKDVRDHNLRGDIARRFYAPATQGVDEVPPFVNFEVRTFADPGSVIPAMRQRVRAIDSSLPPLEPRLLGELVDERVLQERIVAQLSTFFGALALLLAAVGLYGVLAYAVERRTNEIGLRMAIGAERGAVVWLVLRETLVLLATGLVIGGGASLLLARLVASSMYGVTTRDPLTMLAAAAALSIVAIAAATFPALRAAKIDPMVALRVE
jgi:predicted permease